MEELLRVVTRVLLWFTVAAPVAWGVLWVLERVMIGGILGPDVLSVWFSVAGVGLALAAGIVVAHGFDRVLVRQRARESSAASQGIGPSLPTHVGPPRRAR
jgi:hypothetical protein